MEFVYKNPNSQFTNLEIIEDVIKVKKKIGKDKLTFQEYRNNGGICGRKAIFNHFGSWNNLLDGLGIEKNRENLHLSKEDIFKIIKNLWMDKGSQPTLREFETTHHTKKIIASNFGTWTKCLQQFVDWANSNGELLTSSTNFIKHKTSREPNDKLKLEVFKKYGFRCAICGKSRENYPDLELHIDHIIPYSKGGETVLENLQVLCKSCNMGKGNDMI